ncbi:MAG TPA: LptF/LptG family permease [Desulfurivibrionaceae bacterium]|nr:LptF/LptG family permease [Desulfurivibrionaceae bacterium]
MKLLDRYLILQFTRNLLLVLGGLLAIFLLVDFFERVDNFMEAKKGIGLAVKYLLLKIPFIYEQMIPVSILLAGIITLGILNHHHEFMALKASGIPATRIIRPLLAASLLFVVVTLGISQWLLPPTLTETNKIWYEEVNSQTPKGIERNGRIYFRGQDGIYSFARPMPNENLFTDFSYATWDQGFRLATLLTASRATWADGTWTFHDGQFKLMQPDNSHTVQLFATRTVPLPETPEDFFIPAYKAQEKSLSQLIGAAMATDKPTASEAWALLHKKLSYIFLGLPLLLLGLPVLLAMHRTRGRDLALAIPVSCGLAFAAWGVWSATQSMAHAAYLPPTLASWSIHLLGGGLGIYLIRRYDH